MDKKILKVNISVEFAKKKHRQGDLVKAGEIYKDLINKKRPA